MGRMADASHPSTQEGSGDQRTAVSTRLARATYWDWIQPRIQRPCFQIQNKAEMVLTGVCMNSFLPLSLGMLPSCCIPCLLLTSSELAPASNSQSPKLLVFWGKSLTPLAAEPAQWLGALVALADDLGLIPASPQWLTTTCHSYPRGSDVLFRPPLAPGTHLVYT